MTLEEYRKDFEASVNKSVSLPIAGLIVWFLVAAVSTQTSDILASLVLLFASGAIFPIGLVISRLRNEQIMSSENPLSKLMGYSVLMVNLLWALHIPLFIYAPEFAPMSIGIGLGLHWVIYSWVVGHPVGVIHAVVRTGLILLVWFIFPEQRLLAISSVIVLVYCVSIFQMLTRTIELSTST